jgi:pimeloyl-ACP methyl ester carboxylesterase
MRERARQINCPTTILRGARSQVLSDDGAAELAALIPGATWRRVEDAGHTIQSSNPRGLAAAITEFLAEQRD